MKTSFGLTSCAATGENVAQGSIGGAIASSLNLDKTVKRHFAGIEDASYSNLKLSPILYQDDAARFSTSIEEAQKGNIVMSQVMQIKQLEMNVDKMELSYSVKTKKLKILRILLKVRNV